MTKSIDITDMKFGRLTAIKRIKPDGSKFYKWLCKCDCGNTTIVNYADLHRGKVKSCGCYKKNFCIEVGKNQKQYNDYTIQNDIVYVTLNENFIMKCDVDDWNKLKDIKWSKNHYGYASGTDVVSKKKIAFHRVIMGKKEGFVVDHINRDRLDNRKCNLRFLTQRENTWNANLRSNNTTGFTGVRKAGKKWVARIMVDRKNLYLGTYDTKEEAIEARKNAEIIYQPLPERLRRDNP